MCFCSNPYVDGIIILYVPEEEGSARNNFGNHFSLPLTVFEATIAFIFSIQYASSFIESVWDD